MTDLTIAFSLLYLTFVLAVACYSAFPKESLPPYQTSILAIGGKDD